MLIPFISALGYAFATLLLKSALTRGASANQVNCWANIVMALITQPVWLLAQPEVPDAVWWQPLVACGTFFLGQIFTFAALSRGDVSVVTPVLGVKIIGVTAFNALFFAHPIPGRWWIAALIGSLSVALISWSLPKGLPRGNIALPILFSLGAAMCFSITDVFVQHWGGGADPLAFMPFMFGAVGLLNVAYYAMTDRSAFLPPVGARFSLGFGSVLLATQAGLLFMALAWYQDATGANLIYATRSVWSILAAWAIGSAMGLRDVEAGTRLLLWRLLGAVLLFGAILLILI